MGDKVKRKNVKFSVGNVSRQRILYYIYTCSLLEINGEAIYWVGYKLISLIAVYDFAFLYSRLLRSKKHSNTLIFCPEADRLYFIHFTADKWWRKAHRQKRSDIS